MQFTFGADGEVLDQEVPHVAGDVVFKAARLGVHVKAARAKDVGRAGDTAVGGRDDERRQATADHLPIQVFGHAEKELLVL